MTTGVYIYVQTFVFLIYMTCNYNHQNVTLVTKFMDMVAILLIIIWLKVIIYNNDGNF